MLDIKFIRENTELVKAGVIKKHYDVDIDRLLALDEQRRELLQQIEKLREERNEVAASMKGGKPSDELIAKGKQLKDELHELEASLEPIQAQYDNIMLQVPQVPHESVPDGKDDEDNQEIKVWGDKPSFDFEPQSHIDLMLKKGMVDFERGTRMHGFRGYYLKGDGARLSWAIWNYAQEFFLNKGFTPVLPPSIVHKKALYGTGHLPNEVDDIYFTQDDDGLIGTSEISVTGMYMDEIMSEELPVKMLGFSPCYRREAGSHGKDTKGLIRVHEFYKVEQVIICANDEQESVKWHEFINRNTEEFVESLGIPYHTVLNCGGDLGQGQVKKYDIELWVPGEGKYREISSASYFHDFQARRFNIRYKDAEAKTQYVHTLNSTAAPTPRLLVSLVENFQTAEGDILIPEPLRKFMGGREKI